MIAAEKEIKLQRDCCWLYIAYALCSVLCFFNWEMQVICFFGLLIAYGIVSKRHKDAEGTAYDSHLHWLKRTFWVGSLFFIAGNIVMGLYIYYFTDLNEFLAGIGAMGDNYEAITDNLTSYAEKNETSYELANIITTIPPTIWWVHRCWRGYVLAKQGKPVENIMSWR